MSKNKTSRRGFQEVTVARLGVQTPAQRFGPLRTPYTAPDEDSDSEDEVDVDNTHAMPRIEEWRMNLSALSQYHNLYLVAYGDKIYVYEPQGTQQALPSEPALIIEPAQSKEARGDNRLIRRFDAHIINHLIVGNLGNKEIVLCAYHDGDVVAYYTDVIQYAIQNPPVQQGSIFKPFFEENVGNSAWGLAIHGQSRLIAVSSNSHEVQVFAFALSNNSYAKRSFYDGQGNIVTFAEITYLSQRFPKVSQEMPKMGIEGKIGRDRNFRLVFKLEAIGDNIPSISFSDDVYGDAETIVVKDIRGALWFFNLWNNVWKRLPNVPEEPNPHANHVGWGVVVLPRNLFKPTRNALETFGCPESWARRNGKIDISKSIRLVRDSTMLHYIYDTEDEENTEVDYLEIDQEIDAYISLEQADASSSREQGNVMQDPEEDTSDTTSVSQQAQPAKSENWTMFFSIREPWPPSSGGKDAMIQGEPTSDSISHLVSSGSLILHSNRHSFTLLPSSDAFPATHCHKALHQEFPHDDFFSRNIADYDRMNMLAVIPELSLVLVASQVGRVALVTITRRVDRQSRITDVVSMRVDLIIPFTHEESDEKIRPSHGLLGMAVGPMQGERARAAAAAAAGEKGSSSGPRRWRLMLHYFNHAILSYELSRDEENGALMVL